MVIDGSSLIFKVLLYGIKPSAVYCSRLRDIDAELSTAISSSGVKLYQLTLEQAKLARDKGIVSSLFGNCLTALLYVTRRRSDTPF